MFYSTNGQDYSVKTLQRATFSTPPCKLKNEALFKKNPPLGKKGIVMVANYALKALAKLCIIDGSALLADDEDASCAYYQ